MDFNEGMRAALGGAAVGGPLLLSVGADEVAVTTLEASVTERKVTLPGRWLKGFGEGALLGLLASAEAAADADLVSVLLAWDPRIEPGRLSAEAGLPAGRVAAALGCLAAAGRVGYDLVEEAFFHRELPFGAALETMHPRLYGGFIVPPDDDGADLGVDAGGRPAVIPQVTGTAYRTGEHLVSIDPHDPLVPGFVLR